MVKKDEHKRLLRFLDAAERQGFKVEELRGGLRFLVRSQEGETTLVWIGSDNRSILNARSNLRRIGVQL